MTSIMHPTGIWTVPDDETTAKHPTQNAISSANSNTYGDRRAFHSPSKEQTSVERKAAPLELARVPSHVAGNTSRHFSDFGLAQEEGSPRFPISQGVPPEFPNLLAEIIFILTCTGGQLVSALLIGHVTVTQAVFAAKLGIPSSQIPWVLGSYMLSSGLSVVVFGSLADLIPPKPLMTSAFIWEAIWSVIAAVSICVQLKILFFVARAMQSLAVGVLVSASMSILGRVYKPGIRKTRVFSLMGAGAPFGYWVGCLQASALSSHLPWTFGSTAIFLAVCTLAAQLTIPPLRPAQDSSNTEAPSLRQFGYAGAGLASIGCSLVIFGLTQGSSAHWNPYTYSSIICGFIFLGAFYFVEKRVLRPLIPNVLWQTPGFGILLISYFLGLGAYSGWQFYAVQFWQRYHNATPLTTALYLLPNDIVGVLAAYTVSKTLHVVPTHVIFTASMIAFGLGPVIFLPQTPKSNYFALSMPSIALATFGPDMSFAAATIFITSSVPQSYQGAAGSLLVTVQNLTMAVMTSVSEAIGTKVEALPTGEIGPRGIRAIWWLRLAAALTEAPVTATMVRIPKAEEKEHVH